MSRTPEGRTYCPKGHPYDERNALVRKDGKLQCRTCDRIRHRRKRAGTQAWALQCRET